MDLGRIGIWSWQLSGGSAEVGDAAAELEALGYSALWFPNNPAIFERAQGLLEATRRVVVATGIASIWTHAPAQAAAAHHALSEAHPDRFLLGLGVSHPHVVNRDQPGRYRRPLTRMREYLDALDAAAPPVPASQRVLAALGPRMTELARDRSAGAHPYLGTVEHTRMVRDLLGPDRLLAAEVGVLIETDPVRARWMARQGLAIYMQAPNYTNNWLRLGFTADDLADGGSDRLIDAIIAWGDLGAIRARIDEHLAAGADHVCLQVISADRATMPREQWRTLAAVLAD
jgi:probable F420-dependent oxidoreductase